MFEFVYKVDKGDYLCACHHRALCVYEYQRIRRVKYYEFVLSFIKCTHSVSCVMIVHTLNISLAHNSANLLTRHLFSWDRRCKMLDTRRSNGDRLLHVAVDAEKVA